MLPHLPSSPDHKSNKCVEIKLINDPESPENVDVPVRAARTRQKRPKLTSLKVHLKDKLEGTKLRYKLESDYEVIDKLGIGSYSQVYLAKGLETGKQVAIKKGKGSHLVEKEYKLLSTINHEFLPQVFDLKKDEFNKTSYMVMEYIEGTTLDKAIEEETFTEEEAIQFFIDLGSVLKYLHENQIAHRDIKHQNIMVYKKKLVKLIDFNISKKYTLQRQDSSESDDEKSSPGSAALPKGVFMSQVGSPQYGAPEIYSRDTYSEKVDIWGLGLMTYTCLNGLLENDANRSKYNISELPVSDVFKSLLTKCLKYDPDERIGSSDINLEELR